MMRVLNPGAVLDQTSFSDVDEIIDMIADEAQVQSGDLTHYFQPLPSGHNIPVYLIGTRHTWEVNCLAEVSARKEHGRTRSWKHDFYLLSWM